MFLAADQLHYDAIEWKQIEGTALGRRLTSYFNALKSEKRSLAAQLKNLIKAHESEIAGLNQSLKLKFKDDF